MNFSLKPHPLIAQWVPGFVFISILLLGHNGWDLERSLNEFAGVSGYVLILAFAVIAFVVGQVLDAFRSVGEYCWDRHSGRKKIEYDFFFKCTDRRLKNMEEYNFTYYVLDGNMILSVLLSTVLLLVLVFVLNLPSFKMCAALYVGGPVVIIILFLDRRILRFDIVKLTREWKRKHVD